MEFGIDPIIRYKERTTWAKLLELILGPQIHV